MSDLYNQLCNMLIRPSRQTYHSYDLGNPMISTHGKRQDFQLISRGSLRIKCSFYHSKHRDNQKALAFPTLIYLHSLNGSRLEFLTYIEPLLKLGFNISTLDFAGCGISEGSYVTLGAHQKWDVLELVKYICMTYKNFKFIIWGRSMGAVAAIKFYTLFLDQKQLSHSLKNIQILGLVLDSPFISLNKLAVQIAKNKINMPQILIKVAFFVIQNSIQEKAKFKTSELELYDQIHKINVPILIITSKKDTLVSFEHSLSIYNKVSSQDKQLMYIQTQHNNNRQQDDIKKIFDFIQQKSRGSISKKIIYTTGSPERRMEKLKAKSLKKYENSAQPFQRLNRYKSQKNKIHMAKYSNFFQSLTTKDSKSEMLQQKQSTHLKNTRMREFSQDKMIVQSNNQENQTQQNASKIPINENRYFRSAERPKIFFVRQSLHQSCANPASLQKQHQKPVQRSNPNLVSIPQDQQKQKPLNYALSYKNIQCLKTVKKIKRLQPQIQKNSSQGQRQQLLKGHMNVITSKLKKKSKNGLVKSFLPHPIVEIERRNIIQNKKILNKQMNAKSSTILELSNNNQIKHSNHQFQQYYQNKNEKPSTPVFFSTRQIFPSENITKPFTPQFPLHASMRINEIHQRKSCSKQDVLKLYAVQPNQSSKGIKTTLTQKNKLIQQDKYRTVKEHAKQADYQNVEFMSSKKMLNSQIMSMRESNNFDQGKVFALKIRKNQNTTNNIQHETSISLN